MRRIDLVVEFVPLADRQFVMTQVEEWTLCDWQVMLYDAVLPMPFRKYHGYTASKEHER